MEQLALLAVPFITSGIMFGVKWLAGLNLTDNGTASRAFLRGTLILISLGGYIATQTMAHQPVNVDVVSADVQMVLATGVLAYLAHAFYNSAFRRILGAGIDTPTSA